jgi:hypothetical protein
MPGTTVRAAGSSPAAHSGHKPRLGVSPPSHQRTARGRIPALPAPEDALAGRGRMSMQAPRWREGGKQGGSKGEVKAAWSRDAWNGQSSLAFIGSSATTRIVCRADKQRSIRNAHRGGTPTTNQPHTAAISFKRPPSHSYLYRELSMENEVQDNEYDQRNTKQPAE